MIIIEIAYVSYFYISVRTWMCYVNLYVVTASIKIKQPDTTLQHKPYTHFQLPVATNLIAVNPFSSAQTDQHTDVHTTIISYQLA